MMAGNPSNWWNMFPPADSSLSDHPPQFVLGSSNSMNQDQPNSQSSWSQLLLGGLQEEGEEDDHHHRLVLNNNNNNHFQPKKIENLEGRILIPFSRFGVGGGGDDDHHVVVKQQEITCNNSQSSKSLSFLWNNNNNDDEKDQSYSSSSSSANKSSQTRPPVPTSCSSPKSSVNSNPILDFSFCHSKNQIPHHNYNSSQCTASTAATGGVVCKKARVQPASGGQPPIKAVRKEKVGDRITALHQLVSPFGKTDTASVLSEAIGYVRFLQSQIEALISPYLGNNSSKPTKKEQLRTLNDGRNLREIEGENGRCVFPEDPGQLLNDNSLKRKLPPSQEDEDEEAKDLRSRGLCLVPVSCTQLVQSDINGADYWAQAYNGTF